MRNRLSRGPVLAGKGRFPIAEPSTPSAGDTLGGPGTYLLQNSTSDLTPVFTMPASPAVGDEYEFIVDSHTSSTAGATIYVKAPSGYSFTAASDQDVLTFDAANEACLLRCLSTARFGILSNVGSVGNSSST